MRNERSTVLKTKLYIPAPRPDRVDRPRLMARLDEAMRRHQQVTVVSARPGAGKTSLLSSWLRQQPQPAAWLSLDAGDNDPQRFLAGLLEALRSAGLDVDPEILRMLESASLQTAPIQAAKMPSPESVMSALINALAAGAQPLILVLDDYHLIQNAWIHAALGFLTGHQPPDLRLILLTRSDPPLPLALLRGRGQLAEIRDADLQFTETEAEQFLNGAMALNLTAEALVTIENRTEGWIAGLQMAAISLQGRNRGDELESFVAAFRGTHRFILDYLIEAVLNQQTPEIQDFLVETSILDRMCGDLCDAVRSAVTGQAGDSQSILTQLERSNLFVVSLDDARRWYRYHHLFADLLQSILRQTRSAEEIRALHRRAGQWHQAMGDLDAAMTHTMAAQDYDRAAAIIDENIANLFTRSNPPLLLSWIKNLPEAVRREQPLMEVYYATTLVFLGQLAEVEPLLTAVEQRIAVDDPRRIEILGLIAAVRAFAANLSGSGAQAVVMAERSREYLPEGRLVVQGMTAYTLADTYFARDDMQRSTQAFADLFRIGEKTDNLLMTVTALVSQAAVLKVQGRLHQAEERYQKALQYMVDRNGLELRVRSAYEFGLADLLREWNRLDDALEHAVFGSERLKRLGGYLVDGDLTLMRIYQARGEAEDAFRVLRNAENDVQTYHFQLTTMIDFRTARVEQWLAAGDIKTASRWAAECSGGSEKEQIALVKLRLAQGHPEEALRLLETQQPLAEAGERFGRLIEILSLKAITLNAQGRGGEASTALAQAVALAQPEDFWRVFLDLGEPLRMIPQGRAFMETLAPKIEPVQTAVQAPLTVEGLYEAFTPRELEVLRLLAEGLTNKEMAERLVVAPSTVKQHLKNICRKLDVHNRTQAVARGRALKLI